MSDYRLLFARHTEYTSDVYKAARSRIHKRSADRLLHLARTQGAVYVKVGQHVASMNHAVPNEYSSRLRLLEDRAAYRPFAQIRSCVEGELGRPVEDVFAEFEETPVAAASLAQVHRARLREGGEVVAVKVQYPGLEALVRGDVTSIRVLSWLLSWVFPYVNLEWVVDQMKRNLEKEMDFLLEAESARRTREFFKDEKSVGVPRVFEKVSTRRVLTMEYIDGFRVDDLDMMERCGVDRHAVARTVVELFARMIFVNGFVHCDGHGGNVMCRPGVDGAYEVFLLDHGLYRELDDKFRHSYCRLWKGLVLRDGREVERACEELGAGGFSDLFSMFLLNRSWKTAKKVGTDIRVRMSSEELEGLRRDFKKGGLGQEGGIKAFVEKVPDDLLLVFKMNSLVRNVNKSLGASVNRFKVNARYAVRGLWHQNGYKRRDEGGAVVLAGTHSEGKVGWVWSGVVGCGNWVLAGFDRLIVEVNLLLLDGALVAMRWWFGKNLGGIGEKAGDQGLIG